MPPIARRTHVRRFVPGCQGHRRPPRRPAAPFGQGPAPPRPAPRRGASRGEDYLRGDPCR
ncbi:hypothetical protein SCWH03_06980 [Streptomyces pacificus]|uniref:Uncharacterized protein n=1 Tax=Streptomyces pacificus TaxID=2705029 RepID=A0A6A0ARD7_9ACTN|nr:hypothetical protein SCWH03_06980 [Streptomyces pacificus]